MSLYSVPEVYLRRNAKQGKFGGPGQFIPGVPRFVVPGVNASAFAFITDTAKYVYTDINAAYADCVAGQGDVIIALPGAHTLTANLAWNKAQVNLWGWEQWCNIPYLKPSAIITGFAGVTGITVTAADAMLAGVSLVGITAQTLLSFSAAAARLRIHGVHVDLATPAVNIATKGFVASGAAPDVYITNSRFVSGGAQGPAMDLTAVIESVIEGNLIYNNAGTWAVGVQLGAGCKGLKFRKNEFSCYGTAMTVGVDMTGCDQVGGVEYDQNLFHSLVTGQIKNAANNNRATINENFIGTVGAGTGGTLVTVII